MEIKTPLNIQKIRKDFPIFDIKVNGKDLIYFDSAATMLKPKPVVDTIANHYLYETSNVHRGLHFLSDQATSKYEKSRQKIADYIGAEFEEIVFTKGTTESVNIVGQCYGSLLNKGDGILISELEHHSNIVSWQLACERYSLKLYTFKILETGEPDLLDLEEKLKNNIKLLSCTYVSNSLGVIFPVETIIHMAHKHEVKVLVDAAQALAHQEVNVKKLDCDFLVGSAHKIFGPTGIGFLFGKKDLLNQMPPLLGGGGMIDKVTFEKTSYLESPFRFEAGTPHIAGAIGFGAAIDYISQFSIQDIYNYESELTKYACELLSEVEDVKLFGQTSHKGPIVSFVVDGENASDVGSMLDNDGIAVRAGHHCTQPLMNLLGVSGTIRISFSIYNTAKEIEFFVSSLKKVIRILKG